MPVTDLPYASLPVARRMDVRRMDCACWGWVLGVGSGTVDGAYGGKMVGRRVEMFKEGGITGERGVGKVGG